MTTPQLAIDFSATIDVGAKLRDDGHASAMSHYSVEAIRVSIAVVSELREEFTSEDVVDDLNPATAAALTLSPNVLGACIRAAAMAGEIEDTGKMVRARHATARKRKIVVWRRKQCR